MERRSVGTERVRSRPLTPSQSGSWVGDGTGPQTCEEVRVRAQCRPPTPPPVPRTGEGPASSSGSQVPPHLSLTQGPEGHSYSGAQLSVLKLSFFTVNRYFLSLSVCQAQTRYQGLSQEQIRHGPHPGQAEAGGSQRPGKTHKRTGCSPASRAQ